MIGNRIEICEFRPKGKFEMVNLQNEPFYSSFRCKKVGIFFTRKTPYSEKQEIILKERRWLKMPKQPKAFFRVDLGLTKFFNCFSKKKIDFSIFFTFREKFHIFFFSICTFFGKGFSPSMSYHLIINGI